MRRRGKYSLTRIASKLARSLFDSVAPLWIREYLPRRRDSLGVRLSVFHHTLPLRKIGGEFVFGARTTIRGDDAGQVAESIAERLNRTNYVQTRTRCVFGYLSRVGAAKAATGLSA